jgi:beta-N-acetylhexosaminidase
VPICNPKAWGVSLSVPETRPRALVLGCAGPVLGAEERAFFRDADPFGFILFRRNCETPDQVRALVAALRESVGRSDAPVLIDQEGGRVARLRPPEWPAFPAGAAFGDLARRRGIAPAMEAARLNGRILGRVLYDLGITVDCAPVADVPVPGAHDVIGDRALARDPAVVATLARAACEGLLDGGVLPVIKHLPGHGRAFADSHRETPVVDAPRDSLEALDFAPFRALNDVPAGMVAHVVYTAVDPARPASVSPAVVAEVVRGSIGFDGLLFSDDLAMDALSGGMGERGAAVIAAGVDIVLHGNGTPADMTGLAARVGPMSDAAWIRWERARARLAPPAPFDLAAALARRDALLAA